MSTEAAAGPKFSSNEDKLKAMRTGYKFAHELKYGDYPIPVRVLTATEENRVYSEARASVAKIPSITDQEREALLPLETMKLMLMHAATVGSTQNLPKTLLDLLTSAEIQGLYEAYLDVISEVDKNFEKLTQQEITEIVSTVKKNPLATKDLSTRQLKGIGLYFLETLLPMVN